MHHRRAIRADGTSWAARGRAATIVVSFASLLCVALGAIALAVGFSRPPTRTTTAARPWTSTTTFGWSGTAAANDIYPDGQVQSPQPVFLRMLSDITVAADVATSGAAPGGSHPLTLRATLADDTGWRRTWALDRTVVVAGSSAHLSAPLRLSDLQNETSWNQTATGVPSPVTLTLTVDAGSADSPSARLAFSLDKLLFRPLGPLTTTARGAVPVAVHTVGAVRLGGRAISIDTLRTSGLALAGAGVVLAGAAAVTGRRSRRRGEPPAHERRTVPSQRLALDETTRETLSL